MKIILIDGEKITDISLLHKQFSDTLSFPDYYGNNLDALYDMLSERTEKIVVILVNSGALKSNIGDKADAFLKLMKDIENQKENICFIKGL